MSFEDEVELMRLGLATGLLSIDDVANWADVQIELQDKPSSEIVDISNARSLSTSEMISRLGEIPGSANSALTAKMYLGLLARRVRDEEISCREAARQLAQLSSTLGVHTFDKLDPVALEASLRLEDEYALVDSQTFGTLESCDENVREFFRMYVPCEQFIPKGV